MDKKTLPRRTLEENKIFKATSKIAFSLLIVCWLLGLTTMIGPLFWKVFALDNPTFNTGIENAIPIIEALEKFKADHQHYPSTRYELRVFDSSLDQDTLYEYEYEIYPSVDDPTVYMLSFGKRWSSDSWYCYYSEDQKWLEAKSTCWTAPRPNR